MRSLMIVVSDLIELEWERVLFFYLVVVIILIYFRLKKEMLSDLVDDDLLSGSVTVPTSTKTMINMTNTSKFTDF